MSNYICPDCGRVIDHGWSNCYCKVCAEKEKGMIEWYAYRHEDGSLHVKRYFGDHRDITEAESSPFVQMVTEPFVAKDRESALKIAEMRL